MNTLKETNPMLYGFLTSPWFVVMYLVAFILFFEIDWKLGVGWLLWRMASGARKAWEKNQPTSDSTR